MIQDLPSRDPQTETEWQEAADSAHFLLLVDRCYQYGLMTGPEVNVERCEWILEEAKKRGIKPHGRPSRGKIRRLKEMKVECGDAPFVRVNLE